MIALTLVFCLLTWFFINAVGVVLCSYYSNEELNNCSNKNFEFIKFNGLAFLLLVTIFANAVTSFKTVFVVLLFLLALLHFTNRKKIESIWVNIKREALSWGKIYLASNIVLIILWSISYKLVFTTDTAFYISLSEFCTANKVESLKPFFKPFNDIQNFTTTTPYHYFDIWFNAILFKFIGLNNVVIYKYIATPIFGLFYYYGFLSLAANFVRQKLIQHLITVGTVVCVLYFPFRFIGAWGFPFLSFQSLISHKIALVPIFGCFCYNQDTVKNPINKVAYLIVFSILHPIYLCLAAIYCSLLICRFLWAKIKSENNVFIESIKKQILILAIFFVAYLTFYWLVNGSNLYVFAQNDFLKNPVQLFSAKNLLQSLWYIKSISLDTLRYIILAVLIAINFKSIKQMVQAKKHFFAFLFACIFIGVLVLPFFEYLFAEFFQLNFLLKNYSLLIIQVIIYAAILANKSQQAKYIVSKVIIFFHCFFSIIFFGIHFFNNKQSLEKPYITELRKDNVTLSSIGVAFTKKIEKADEQNLMNLYTPPFAIDAKNYQDNVWITAVTLPDDTMLKSFINTESTFRIGQKRVLCNNAYNMPFNIYCKQNKSKSVEDNQVGFIHNYNINFALVEANAVVPKKVMDITKKIIPNQQSGDCLYLF